MRKRGLARFVRKSLYIGAKIAYTALKTGQTCSHKRAGYEMSSKKTKARLVADNRYGKRPGKGKAPGKSKAKPRKSPARKKSVASKKQPRRLGVLGTLLWPFSFALRLIWAAAWRISLVAGLVLAAAVAFVYVTLPDASDLLDGRARGSVTLKDRNNKTFAWRGDQYGGSITAASVSPHLKNAVVATEDKRFYWHPGVDPIGIASAIKINLSEGRGALSGHGGSTITQQTAKLLCLGKEFDPSSGQSEAEYEEQCRRGTLERKLREAIYALAMEVKYTKDEILTIYLNRAFLGAGSRGFEAASQRYFGKPSAQVNPAEAAMLAGLLKAPSRFAPTNNLTRSQKRANLIVGLMEEQGYISSAQAESARQKPAQLSAAARAKAGGYFADWVMASGPEFFTSNTTEDVIITTTLDPRIQKAAEEALFHVFETKVKKGSRAQAAIVVMSADGAVRAMVGGRKTRVAGEWNRATQARRQTGSAFKPFVYATALELGHSPLSTVVDEPYTFNVPGSGPYAPRNYTGKHYGRVTLMEALEKSLNVPAVKVSEAVGRENVRKVAADFGIVSGLADGPAMALGASEATLIEMTGAYAGILNGGSSVTPYGLVELRLQGEKTPLMGSGGGIGERVIREKAARELTYMMEKVISEGTGKRARLNQRPAAGKTGTTQAARDAWFIGFTADYVAGVWMGNDDNTPLTGVTGGGLPAQIWRETMERVHAGMPVKALPMQAPPAPKRIKRKPAQNNGTTADSVLQQVLRDLTKP